MATNNPTHTHIIMASFPSERKAENAVEELHDKGFTSDQIRYSRQYTKENFLESIKDLLIFPDERQDESESDIATMLHNMGITQEQIQYYTDEFSSGRFVVVVRPDERDQEARDILLKHGGNGYSNK